MKTQAAVASQSTDANRWKRQLIDALRAFLPGDPVPTQLLEVQPRDERHPAWKRWRGRYGALDVEAMESTNESQWHCPPWGSISDVEFRIAMEGGATQDRVSGVMSDLLETTAARDPQAKRSLWLRRSKRGRVVWYAALRSVDSGVVILQIGCAAPSDVSVRPRNLDEVREHLDTVFARNPPKQGPEEPPPSGS
jgi:hypothetical protein